jgi:hypothetical protein
LLKVSLAQASWLVRCVIVCLLFAPGQAAAQNRGNYPVGLTATNSGAIPDAGLSYATQLLFFSRDDSRGPDGEVVQTGQNSVILSLTSFLWAGRRELLGGARLSMAGTLILTNNALSADLGGSISGGGGLGDTYVQPFILGWKKDRTEIKALYGFLAPTGEFSPGANRNVGSGYWTNVFASGQTVYLTQDRKTAASAFQMYEFHTVQKGTGIHPGDTLDLDYSLTRTMALNEDVRLQAGLAGYGMWQTTGRTGPNITSAEASARYAVNGLGFASNVVWPRRDVSLGFKYFKEFANRSTFQGYAVQISGSVGF